MLFLFILLYTWSNVSGAGGLKITKLSVPNLVDVRSLAVLSCDFDLENSNLYSVKWYKDDLEFYRFMPDGTPNVQIFNVEGVHLSTKQNNVTTVILSPLEFSTSGVYTCEVSTEAPYFKTVQTASNMTVMGIPNKNPVFSGLEDIYAVGDYVEGNCTSDVSYPFAALDWYINGNQVESWQLEKYPTVAEDRDGFQLKRSILGVSFQVDHSHFSGKGNTMVLKCIAKVGDISRQVVHISKLADLDLEKSAQGLYGNGGCTMEWKLSSWITLILVVVGANNLHLALVRQRFQQTI